MYRVIAIDDEPVALAHICSIIEKRCPDFKVIETAENGVEALDKVRRLHPDLVVSDVKMPLMNGIELVTAIRQELPDIYSVVVSGYQDFEYARGAMQSGVCDYILKPVIPADVQAVLELVAGKLKVDYYQARNDIIRKLCNGMECDNEAIERYFPYERYYGAIIRKNGLPKRFSNIGNMEIYSDVNELMTVYGRDEMEALYIIPQEMLTGTSFHEYIRKVQEKSATADQYSTLVFSGDSFPVDEMQQVVKACYRGLDTVTVVGYTQARELKSVKEIVYKHGEINYVLKRFEYRLKEHQIHKLKKELYELCKKWKDEKKPQLWMEYVFRQILYIFRKHSEDSVSLTECEYMLEDAFFYAASADILIENLFEIIFHSIQEKQISAKVDSPEFFARICNYMEEHLAENISLQLACRQFGISQTYLSRMFRKYANQSFNRYFIELRMEKAMQLMRENQDLYVKDVALLVGYTDQFYFSRIFRSYTGKCPSDYLEEI